MVNPFYFDTSALVKNYIREPGSQWVRSAVGNAQTAVLTSTLTTIESVCAFARCHREGLLSEDDLTQTRALLEHDFLCRYSVLWCSSALTSVCWRSPRQKGCCSRTPIATPDAPGVSAITPAEFLERIGELITNKTESDVQTRTRNGF